MEIRVTYLRLCSGKNHNAITEWRVILESFQTPERIGKGEFIETLGFKANWELLE